MPAPAPGSVVDERPAPAPGSATHAVHLDQANQALAAAPAQDIIRWAYDTFGGGLILTSSFGVQAAVMLHLATQVVPDIPVVFIDTGYLHKETYLFADELARRLKLNLKVYQSHFSPARMEALHGRLWEVETKESLDTYDRLRKVEPMQRALRDLGAKAWLAGLRKGQTEHRNSLRVVERQGELFKVHPILNWTGKQVHEYLKQHDLPYHPLRDQGYASIGDWHSTRPIAPGEDERAGRFKGLKQECGLHLPTPGAENASLGSSDL